MAIRRVAAFNPRWAVIAAALATGILATTPAMAGGVQLYEIGTDDLGLAAAGYAARAQDASTILTNPAGMTRLDGTQLLVGGQLLYGNIGFSLGDGTSPDLGTGDGGNPIGWLPGASLFASFSPAKKVKLGMGVAGNFGLAESYDSDWAGRYYVQKATLLGVSFLPSFAYQVSDELSLGLSVRAMYGVLDQEVAVNNITGSDGLLKVDDRTWGWGASAGLLWQPGKATRLGVTYNSQISLPFSSPAQFSGLASGLETVLRNRGLLNAGIDLEIHVPQGAMVSLFRQAGDRWAVLGSAGWQQWSRFGKVDVGIDSSNPAGFTTDLDFKDTWHASAGAQYQVDKPWILNFGIAYDSAFQDSSNVSPALPANAATRIGIGARHEGAKKMSWGIGAEYAYGGTLHVEKHSQAPVVLGGRGDLSGSYNSGGILFLAGNLNWKF